MATTTGMKVEGVEFVSGMLEQLPGIAANRVARNALSAGARIVRKQAQANLTAHGSVDTGLLRATLSIYRKGANASKTVVTLRASGKLVMVQRKGSKKLTPARPSKYAHLVEYGTEHSVAAPFFRPAVDTKKEEAVQAIIDGAARSLVREAGKIGLAAKLG